MTKNCSIETNFFYGVSHALATIQADYQRVVS